MLCYLLCIIKLRVLVDSSVWYNFPMFAVREIILNEDECLVLEPADQVFKVGGLAGAWLADEEQRPFGGEGDDGPFGAKQSVEQAAFTYVRLTDDGRAYPMAVDDAPVGAGKQIV